MKGFLSCDSPVRIDTLKGLKLVACGKCIQCKSSRRKKTELLLSLETQAHAFCELINLTYSDDFIPYVDFSCIDGCSVNGSYDDYSRTVHPLVLGNRVKDVFNPRDGKYHTVPDKSALNRFVITSRVERYWDYDTFVPSVWLSDLQNYNKRIDEYYERYPFRKRGLSRMHNHVAILFNEDLQKFLDRLKKWCLRNFGAKIRYFAVGEYGSNSLRPHWHIVLFHDSPLLRKSFQHVYVYPNSTALNPRECNSKMYNDKIWRFGDITTTVTDGHASSYLSGYLNQSSCMPRLLDLFPQKSFKSIFLGEKRDFEELSSLLKGRDFQRLSTATVVSRKGLEHTVPVPSSSYHRFHIGFSFDGLYSVKAMFTLLSAAKYLDKRIDLSLTDDVQLRDLLLFLNRQSDSFSNSSFEQVIQPLVSYVHRFAFKAYCDFSTLNPLKSLFYASRKLYKISTLLNIDVYRYLLLVDDFEHYLDYQNLVQHFKLLEDNPTLSVQYYSSLDPISGIPLYSLYRQYSYFINQSSLASLDYYNSIKHKEVVMSYKTDL
jgi:hypothetical protein